MQNVLKQVGASGQFATAMIGRITPHTRADVPSISGNCDTVIRFCTSPMPTATAAATAADSVGVNQPE